MKKREFTLVLALAVAGCAQPAPVHPTLAFGLTSLDQAGTVVAPASRGLPGAGTGTLTLDLSAIARRLAAKRTVLFAVADIDHLDIVITMPPSFTTSAQVTKAELAGGSATRTFTDLPGGTIHIAITARDAQGQVLGADTSDVQIIAFQTATYQPNILLLPSGAAPTPSPAPAGGGSGTPPAGGTTGFTVQVGLVDGGSYVTPTSLGSAPYWTERGVVDAAGNIWSDVGLASGYALTKFGPTGAVLASTPLTPGLGGIGIPLRIDAGGGVWLGTDDALTRYDPAQGAAPRTYHSGYDVAFDAAGNAYVLEGNGNPIMAGAGKIWKYTAGGVAAGSIDLPTAKGRCSRIFVNPAGELVVFRYSAEDPDMDTFFVVSRFKTDGTHLGTYVRQNPLHNSNVYYYSNCADMDAQGNLWVTCAPESRLIKLAPDLSIVSEVATYSYPMNLDVDAAGKVWVGCNTVYDGVAASYLLRYASDGTREATAKLPEVMDDFDTSIAADGHGNVWVPSRTSLSKFTF